MHAPFRNKGFIPPAASTAVVQTPLVLAPREWPLTKETYVAQEHISSQGSLYPLTGQRGAMQAQPFIQLKTTPKLCARTFHSVANLFLCLTLFPSFHFHKYDS